MMNIVVIENDKSIKDILRFYLTDIEKHDVVIAENGVKGLRYVEKLRPDLIILDTTLPDINGFEVYRAINSNPDKYGQPAVIIVSEAAREDDVAEGYALGGIDFIKKPIKFEELCGKIQSLEKLINRRTNIYKFKDLIVDIENRQITENGIEIKLTKTEYKLLVYMLENRGKVLDRNRLMNQIWNSNYIAESDRCIDMCVYRIKKKIESIKKEIECISGEGYRLKKP